MNFEALLNTPVAKLEEIAVASTPAGIVARYLRDSVTSLTCGAKYQARMVRMAQKHYDFVVSRGYEFPFHLFT